MPTAGRPCWPAVLSRQPTVMRVSRLLWVALLFVALNVGSAHGQRERTRPSPRRSTPVSQSQASELTLTLTEVAVRPLQVWIRVAGTVDAARRTVTAVVPEASASRVRTGQRVRAFSPASRSRMYQGTIAQIAAGPGGATVRVNLMGQTLEAARHYVLEIVTEGGEFLSVPNEAIIENGGTPLVYVQEPDGSYAPREIKLGVQGELYTQILDGVKTGDQVVTIGSFFIDAEHKLKGS